MDTSTLKILNSILQAETSPFQEENKIEELGLLASFFANNFHGEPEIVVNADTETVYKIYELDGGHVEHHSQNHYKYATLFLNAPNDNQLKKLSLTQETEARKKQAYNCHMIGLNDGQCYNPCWVAELYNYTDMDKTIRNFLSIVGFYCKEVDIVFNGHGSPGGLLFVSEPEPIPQSRLISDASRIWSEIKRNKVNEGPMLMKIKVVLTQCYSHVYNPNDNPEVSPIIEAIPLSTSDMPFTYYSLTWGPVADIATDGATGSQGLKRTITDSHHLAAEDYVKKSKTSAREVNDPPNHPSASIDVLPGEASDSTSVMNRAAESEERGSGTLDWIPNSAKAVAIGAGLLAVVGVASYFASTQSSSDSEYTDESSSNSEHTDESSSDSENTVESSSDSENAGESSSDSENDE